MQQALAAAAEAAATAITAHQAAEPLLQGHNLLEELITQVASSSTGMSYPEALNVARVASQCAFHYQSSLSVSSSPPDSSPNTVVLRALSGDSAVLAPIPLFQSVEHSKDLVTLYHLPDKSPLYGTISVPTYEDLLPQGLTLKSVIERDEAVAIVAFQRIRTDLDALKIVCSSMIDRLAELSALQQFHHGAFLLLDALSKKTVHP